MPALFAQSNALPELRAGDELRDTLEDGAPKVETEILNAGYNRFPTVGQRYRVSFKRSGLYSFDLRSAYFDSYLVLRNGKNEVVAEDDDGLVAVHSRLSAELIAGEVYVLEACALHGLRGSYTLTMRKGEPKRGENVEWDDEEIEVRIQTAFEEPANTRRLPVYLFNTRDPTHFHECAHQIMSNILRLGGGGSWYQEGVAEYYEDTVRKFNRRAETRNAIRSDQTASWEELLTAPSMLFSAGENLKGAGGASGNYGQAASLIMFFKDGPRKKQFQEFLHAMGKVPRSDLPAIEGVFRDVFDASLEELEAEWVEYFAG